MKRTILPKTYFALAILFAVTLNAGAQIANGGFETGTFPPWVLVDPSGNSTINDPIAFPGTIAFAHGGTHYASLGTALAPPLAPTTGSLSQTFSTFAGSRYTVSYWLANDDGTPVNTFSAFFNGSLVVGSAVSAQTGFVSNGVYQLFSFSNLLAVGTSSTLRFDFRHDADFWRLDDVRVVATPEGGAPLWLALPVFAGLCLVHLRLNRRAGSRS